MSRYTLTNLLGHVIMTIITCGFWLIWMTITEEW